MALNWNPLTAGTEQMSQASNVGANTDIRGIGGMLGQLLGEGIHQSVDTQDIQAKDAGEYIRGYARRYAKDNNMDYEEMVANYPLLQMAESGAELKADSQGKLMYKTKDSEGNVIWSDDFGGMQGSIKDKEGNVMWSPFGSRTISGQVLGADDKPMELEKTADPFEDAFDTAWREGLFKGEGLSYKAPKTRLQALFSRDRYRPRGTGRYVENPSGALGDYVDILSEQYGGKDNRITAKAYDKTKKEEEQEQNWLTKLLTMLTTSGYGQNTGVVDGYKHTDNDNEDDENGVKNGFSFQ
tara:strand:- start:2198 stop:3088 length:891 start_codon:yes stop_codon:yes gene_type:complete